MLNQQNQEITEAWEGGNTISFYTYVSILLLCIPTILSFYTYGIHANIFRLIPPCMHAYINNIERFC